MNRERRRRISAGLIAFGAALRLWQFFGRGSFWLDEAALARNVADRSFGALLRPLDYAQIAPKGFLLVQRALLDLFGPSERTLRLYALLTGLASLPLFYALARRVLDDRAALVALAFFAVLGRTVYYASEAKQYGGDVFFACLLLLLSLRVLAYDAGTRHWLRLGVLGALSVWFSQPALFILGGVGVALLVAVVLRRIPLRWPAIVACVLWAVSGIPSILLNLRSLGPREQAYMRSFWRAGFWPLPPHSLHDLAWPFVNFYGVFRDPLAMPVTAVGIGLFIVGCVVLGRRRPVQLAALLAPLGVAYIAAAARVFPFDTTVLGFNKIAAGNGRLLLFLVPPLTIVVVAGTMALVESTVPRVRWVGLAAATLLLGAPLYYDVAELPYSPHDLQPLFRVLREQARPDDDLYVYYGARQAFEWYRGRVDLPTRNVVLGGCYRPAWREYVRELDRFRGRGRLWILVTHPASIHRVREMGMAEAYMDRIAPKLGRWGSTDSFLLLYDMSATRAPEGDPAAWHPPPRQLAWADTIDLGTSCMGVFPGPGVPGAVLEH